MTKNQTPPTNYDVTTTRVVGNIAGWVLVGASFLIGSAGSWWIVVGVIAFLVGVVLIFKTGPDWKEEKKQ